MPSDWGEEIVEPFYPVSLGGNQPADVKEIENLVFFIEMDPCLTDQKLKGGMAGPWNRRFRSSVSKKTHRNTFKWTRVIVPFLA